MRLIFVTQIMDSADPVLGASADLARALAARCDRLAVVANEVRTIPPNLDAEVLSLGKENGAGRFVRGLRYERAVTRLSRGLPANALLAHMCPVYLTLAAPITKLLGVRTVLWYAHPARTVSLSLAERLADTILTSLPGAYPGRVRDVYAIGQAIDVEAFPYAEPRPPDGSLRLLALGRTSPSKGYPVAVQGITRARERGLDVRLRIVGPSTTTAEERHREELLRLIDALGMQGAVGLESGVPRSETRSLLRWCDALVNTTIAGSGDKAVFEAMAVGRPVIASNPAFGGLLSHLPLNLVFTDGSPGELAELVLQFSRTDRTVRDDCGRELRRRVEQGHSLVHWTERVIHLATEGQPPVVGRHFLGGPDG
jgi:glycosyltransferase involved in cell wall biosynthesis